MTREADWVSADETAVSRYGKLDILVNNAGITIRRNVEDTTAEDWDCIMAINAKGVPRGIRGRSPFMRSCYCSKNWRTSCSDGSLSYRLYMVKALRSGSPAKWRS